MCQGKDARFFFSESTTQFINTLALDKLQDLDSMNYFLSCYGKHSFLHMEAAITLSDSK